MHFITCMIYFKIWAEKSILHCRNVAYGSLKLFYQPEVGCRIHVSHVCWCFHFQNQQPQTLAMTLKLFLIPFSMKNLGNAECICQRWSARGRPWPRGHILKSSASKPQVLGLGLEALGPRKLPCPRLEDSPIFEPLKFCWNTPETLRKICKYLFCFPQLEHWLSQAGLPPIKISSMTKM